MSTNDERAKDAEARAVLHRFWECGAGCLSTVRRAARTVLLATEDQAARLDSLAGEVERLRAEMNALVIGHVAEDCREKLQAAMAHLPDDEWRAICAMFAECERVAKGHRDRAEAEVARLRDEAVDRRYVYEAYHKAEAENEYLREELRQIAVLIRRLPKATECPAIAARIDAALAAQPQGVGS